MASIYGQVLIIVVPDGTKGSTELDHYDQHSDQRSGTFSYTKLVHTLLIPY